MRVSQIAGVSECECIRVQVSGSASVWECECLGVRVPRILQQSWLAGGEAVCAAGEGRELLDIFVPPCIGEVTRVGKTVVRAYAVPLVAPSARRAYLPRGIAKFVMATAC